MQSAGGRAYQQALLEGKSEDDAQRIADEAGKDVSVVCWSQERNRWEEKEEAE